MKKIIITSSVLIILTFISWKVFDKNTDQTISPQGIYDNDINYISNTNSSADRYISALKEQLIEAPENINILNKLGAAYIQKARETNDPEYYASAENVLNRSIDLQQENFLAYAELGSVKLSRHHFREALELSEKSLTQNPYSAYSYGVLVDAQVELGMYDEAIISLQKMVDLRPDLSSYSRISYVRELFGDTEGAIDAMESAVNAGSPVAENTVWCKYQLANLYYNIGNTDTAAEMFQEIIFEYPEYSYAYAGMAKIKMHQNKYSEAIDLYSKAIQKNSVPEFLISLGDAYTLNGEIEKAEEVYNKVKFLITFYKQNGIETDLEMALFNADHGIRVEESFEISERSLQEGSRCIKSFHAAAWTAFKSGNLNAAENYISQALRLGTKNPLLYFHAGKIFEKSDKQSEADEYLNFALSINPFYESLYVKN